MNFDLLWSIAQTFATTALVSVGGISTMIPEIHRQAVEIYGWMSDAQFASSFAISQVAPGPNVLLMSLVGWRVAGFAGMMVATLSTIIPTSIICLMASRLENKLTHAKWYSVTRKSLPPLIVGLIFSSGVVTARAAVVDAMGGVIVVCVGIYFFLSKSNPLISIFASIVVGVVAGRLGWLQ
jgi:chromate transporter